MKTMFALIWDFKERGGREIWADKTCNKNRELCMNWTKKWKVKVIEGFGAWDIQNA